MNPTTELLSKLNTMQSEHIKLLNERIDNINEHKQHLNETISSQAKQLERCYKSITSDAQELLKKKSNKIQELKYKVKVLSNACKGKDKVIYKLKNELRSNKE